MALAQPRLFVGPEHLPHVITRLLAHRRIKKVIAQQKIIAGSSEYT